MSSNFFSDYFSVGLIADRPANPVLDPGTNPEMPVLYFATDTDEIWLFDPDGEVWIQISTGSSSGYTDEEAQDAVGAMIDASLNYVDGTPLLQRAALTGAVTASAGSNTTALGSFTKAQLDTAVSDGNVLYVGDVTQYTDELAQDAVGGMVDASLTYVDGTPLLQRAALTGNVTAAAGSNATVIAAGVVTPAMMSFKGALVRKAGDLTGANFTAGPVLAWDQEAYDVGGWHDNVTANTKLIVPAGVTYVQVGANVVLANMAVDTWAALILNKGGTNAFDGACAHRTEIGNVTSPNISICSGPIAVSAADEFEVVLSVESDTTVDVTATRSNFWIRALA